MTNDETSAMYSCSHPGCMQIFVGVKHATEHAATQHAEWLNTTAEPCCVDVFACVKREATAYT